MNALIFGATGSVGNYIYNKFKDQDFNIIGTTSKSENTTNSILYVDNNNCNNLYNIDELDIVIWAQGYNFNDNITEFNYINYNKIMDINVGFILNTLNYLVSNNKIKNGAKLVIVSSIWEELTRDNKLSYSISKSALSGLVKNIAYNLSSKNILVNNVLPGVIDNEMTNKTLTDEQKNYIKNYMNFGRFVNLDDIYKTIKFLVTENTGITGQSIKVDLGFTHLKKYS